MKDTETDLAKSGNLFNLYSPALFSIHKSMDLALCTSIIPLNTVKILCQTNKQTNSQNKTLRWQAKIVSGIWRWGDCTHEPQVASRYFTQPTTIGYWQIVSASGFIYLETAVDYFWLHRVNPSLSISYLDGFRQLCKWGWDEATFIGSIPQLLPGHVCLDWYKHGKALRSDSDLFYLYQPQSNPGWLYNLKKN